MSFVITTKGLVSEDQLTTKYIETNEPKIISLAREWYLGEELVRRDVWVTVKEGQSTSNEKGSLNG
jgi:hypothetical protein